MYGRLWLWRHAIAIAFACLWWTILPATMSAQITAAQHLKECTDGNNVQSEAMEKNDASLIISSTRWLLTNCRDLMRGPDEADDLSALGLALTQERNFEDALPILQRCVAIEPDAAYCYADMGDALFGLGRIEDAKNSYERAISIGGYDDMNAVAVAGAHKRLAEIATDALPPTPPPVPIENERFGTGFFVSAAGHILTNNHVIDGCKSISTTGGNSLSIVSQNQEADLAVLKANIKPKTFATFGKRPLVGEQVMAFGFPLPGLLSAEGNTTTGIISALSGPGGDLNVIQITAPVQPGNSGGPLVDQNGRVVGVIVSKLDALQVAKITGDVPQNVNFAIRDTVATSFLDSVGVPYRTTGPTAPLGWPTVAESEKSMSVALVCTE